MVTFQLIDLLTNHPGNGEVHSSFRTALNDLYKRVNHAWDNENLSLQWLETAVWIKVIDDENDFEGVIHFYDARDLAIKCGLVNDGASVVNDIDDGQEPHVLVLVEVARLCSTLGNAQKFIQGLEINA